MPEKNTLDTPAERKSVKPARLFIAILFDEKTVDFLDTAVVRLREISSAGRFVRRENLHLTLAFLGQVERSRIDELKQVLAGATGDTMIQHPSETSPRPSIPLTFTGVGRFRQRQGDTCWIGIEAESRLVELHDRLISALLEVGLPVDQKPFKPHITVGREVVLKEGLKNGSSFNQWQVDSLPYVTPVNAIHLMESSFQQGQLTYTSLHEQPMFGL